ncbi:MAG: Nicotinate-nucleotide adenylyltransferase [Firmicutes bacterium ADurb.Bin506]|jgi:nicotinate-nucleotide adenylyltransferase|nr:MAG: Nicotinate-nucleotide adenylyltransferase [Firmicutes bacterium ADurb.Bin506]
MQRIGIMGGTFDPIHYGHLVTAEQARFTFGLDRVVFVPTGRPPHKQEKDVSEAEHRLTMTRLATQSNVHFGVSSIEVDRPGPTYAIDTVREFKQLYPPGTELLFITGADAVLQMTGWKDYDVLMQLCEFVAATRPGYVLEHERIAQMFGPNASKINFFEVPALAISSTDIRARVRSGRPVRYLLPDVVIDYIFASKLYTCSR